MDARCATYLILLELLNETWHWRYGR